MNANQEEKEQARDGHDNTGTQGYDSLQDAGYTGTGEGRKANPGTGTGSSSESFHEVASPEKEISDEDRALDSGI
ncbi:hypothetical protein ACTHQF_12495 [Pedobacter sp. SAFR-022]|uniref:hypothetical protein n=1 Tax=Pedobacter sp. SAFR-022 TaxID=3436861 RepID=UPI003F814231